MLERMSPDAGATHITVFSAQLSEEDISLIDNTLASLRKPFTLQLKRIDNALFRGFPLMNGSYAAYYRLHAAQQMEVDRFLYLDVDILCDIDVSPLAQFDMGGRPLAWVPEAPLALAVDRDVGEMLGNGAADFYFNSGVLLVDVAEWNRQDISAHAMHYLATHQAHFYDQSALNVVLFGNSIVLDERFNCLANSRRNWPMIRGSYGSLGRLVHFVDYPKPWDIFGEFVHPQYALWGSVLNKTAMKGFRSWHTSSSRKFPRTCKAWSAYEKALKDRLLFTGYSHGWLRRIKGLGGL
jgi:lipopolysaccharide biosynthesis glycosyltransferase